MSQRLRVSRKKSGNARGVLVRSNVPIVIQRRPQKKQTDNSKDKQPNKVKVVSSQHVSRNLDLLN